MDERPQIPADQPDFWKSWNSDSWRRWAESHVGEFYQPKSRAGRFAETIGEMLPMLLGGEALSIGLGLQTLDVARREILKTLVKHAIAPGVAVQTLEETLPDTQAGQTMQKAYPVLRRVLPAALAAKQYLVRS